MEILQFELPNGIRIAHKPIPSRIVCCGITINAGTRDERDGEHGLAHFIEHVIFKGTQSKTAKEIAQVIEADGGELNAFTTKEETVLHCTLLKDGFEPAVELLADLFQNATFPASELKKEKEVIRDEINSYHDSPSELIFDRFESMIFNQDPMGWDILGRKKDLRAFTPAKIRHFMERNYHTDQMVFSVVGDFSETEIRRLAERYFSPIPERRRTWERSETAPYIPKSCSSKRDTYQAHCVLGTRAFTYHQKERFALSLLTNLLGGPCQNSLLNQSLREDRGLVYNVEAGYTPYSNTGLFNIYFGCDKKNLNTCLELVHNQLEALREIPLDEITLQAAKRQFIGQITISTESYEQNMLNLGKSILSYNRIESFEESLKEIEAITPETLRVIAQDLFAPDQISQLIFK